MCKVQDRCAGHTRGPCDAASAEFHEQWGADANKPGPLETVEANYVKQRVDLQRQQAVEAKQAATRPTRNQAAPARLGVPVAANRRVAHARFQNAEQAQRAVMLSSAMGRRAGSSALAAVRQVRQNQGADRLRDPVAAQAVVATHSASGRASASAAHGALSHMSESGTVGLTRTGASAQAAGTRVAASGAASALGALREKGWSNPHAGLVLA